MIDLTPLREQLARNKSLDASIIALVKDFAAKVEANKGDPVAIQEIVDSFRADNDVLAAAVIEHTPAAPPA
jgi:hypothetical protein